MFALFCSSRFYRHLLNLAGLCRLIRGTLQWGGSLLSPAALGPGLLGLLVGWSGPGITGETGETFTESHAGPPDASGVTDRMAMEARAQTILIALGSPGVKTDQTPMSDLLVTIAYQDSDVVPC